MLSNNYKSKPRNKLIADFCKSIGLIEKYGSGIRRIVEYFKEAQLPRPEFRNISDGFMVTVFATNKDIEEVGGAIGGAITRTENGLSGSKAQIIALIKESPTISYREISKKININESAIIKHIKGLKEAGLLIRMGGTRGFWKIN